MARESFLLRIDPKILAALRRWADDEVRSVNAQVEFLLRQALRNAGRLTQHEEGPGNTGEPSAPTPTTDVET